MERNDDAKKMLGKLWKWCSSSTLHHSFYHKSELDLIMMMKIMMTMVASYKSLSPPLPSLSERTGLIIPVGHFHLPSSISPSLLCLVTRPFFGSEARRQVFISQFYFLAPTAPPRPVSFLWLFLIHCWWVVKLSGEWSITTHKCNIVEI